MLPRLYLTASVCLLLLCFLFDATAGRAQSFDLEADRVQMAELRGQWRFHPGDDPGWADPALDDSSWQLLQSDKPWSEQGYKDYGGMAWYRFQVVVPAKHGPLALLLPRFLTSYQVFADGHFVGQYGELPPHPVAYLGPSQVMALPASAGSNGRPIEIAIRVWHWPVWAMYYGGGPAGPTQLGRQDLLVAWQQARERDRYWDYSSNNVELLVAALAAVGALGFFFLYRLDREFLWYGLYEATTAGVCAFDDIRGLQQHGLVLWQVPGALISRAGELLFLTFLWAILKRRRDRRYWVAFWSVLLSLVPFVLGEFDRMTVSQMNLWNDLLIYPYMAIILAVLGKQAYRRNRDARLLLLPVALNYGVYAATGLLWSYEAAGHGGFRMRHAAWLYSLTNWPFPIAALDVTSLVMELAILAILVARFADTRRDEQRFASELEAARVVQHVLIPEQIPEVSGLHIEAAYKPAGEVGGDFFQILPLPDAGVIVAIGDVSGKGMPAAMTVSLLVGTLRSVTQFVRSPAEILAAMNQQLMNRSAGFTTCLVARVDPQGTLTLANAGHLAPYVEGREVALKASLPLGLVPNTEYDETTLSLLPNEQVTFVTDGVVEAQSPTGELFGFERTSQVAMHSAKAIMEVASQFGSGDDITVVTFSRQGTHSEHGQIYTADVQDLSA